jgi:hypothetical protein
MYSPLSVDGDTESVRLHARLPDEIPGAPEHWHHRSAAARRGDPSRLGVQNSDRIAHNQLE